MNTDPNVPFMRLSTLFHLLRPRQWIKNAFVVAPLFFSAAHWTLQSVKDVSLGVVVFCLLSSAIYIFNDIFDRKADQLHSTKKHRPLASGAVSLSTAWILFTLLSLVGINLAFFLGGSFLWFALGYYILQIFYCFWLKHISLIDVVVISLGFVLRVLAGAALIATTPTPWIIIMTTLLALFQGLAKRRDDLVREVDGSHRPSLRGYNKHFLDVSISVILGSLLVAYLIFTTDQFVIARFGTENLFYTTPLVILGILRYLQITLVEEKSGSPTEIVLRDRFLILSILGWIISFVLVTHAG